MRELLRYVHKKTGDTWHAKIDDIEVIINSNDIDKFIKGFEFMPMQVVLFHWTKNTERIIWRNVSANRVLIPKLLTNGYPCKIDFRCFKSISDTKLSFDIINPKTGEVFFEKNNIYSHEDVLERTKGIQDDLHYGEVV